MTVRDVVTASTSSSTRKGVPSPRVDAEHSSPMPSAHRLDIYLEYDGR